MDLRKRDAISKSSPDKTAEWHIYFDKQDKELRKRKSMIIQEEKCKVY